MGANNKKKNDKQFKEEVFCLVGKEYSFLTVYTNNKTKLFVRHNSESCSNHEYYIAPKDFLKGSRCPKCASKIVGKKLATTPQEFLNSVKELVGEEYSILSEYKNSRTKVLFLHNECGQPFLMSPDKFKSGQRCPIHRYERIADKKLIPLTEIMEDLRKCGYELVEFPEGYKSHKSRVKVVCSNDHTTIKSVYSIRMGYKCPNCKNYSKGEDAVEEYLKRNNIPYIPQFRIDECRNKNPLPFDFAILNRKGEVVFLIEYHGIQHYEPKDFFGGENGFNERLRNDKIKQEYCLKNNMKLVVIPYEDILNINSILDSTLKGGD